MRLGGVCIQKNSKNGHLSRTKQRISQRSFARKLVYAAGLESFFFLIHMREEQSSGAYEGKISNVVTGVGGKPCAGDFGMYLNVAHFFAQKKIDVRSCRLSCPLPSLVP